MWAQKYELWSRNPLAVIQGLFSNPLFKEEMVYGPEQRFCCKGRRLYSEMHCSDWWWRTQASHICFFGFWLLLCVLLFVYLFSLCYLHVWSFLSWSGTHQDTLPEGATLIPILLGIDETNVNTVGRMQCHPIYLSIGNLPKKTQCTYSQHAYVLIGYLPSLQAVGMEGDRPAFTEAKRVLYQECLMMILKDLDHATQM
jgi:hypothetical protein